MISTPPPGQRVGNGVDFLDQLGTVLQNATLFAQVGRDKLTILAGFLEVYRAPANTVIIREGEESDYLLIVLEGRIDISKKDRNGNSVAVARAEVGKTLGEMSMVDGAPRFATCTAATDVAYGVLTRMALLDIVAKHPDLGAQILMQVVALLSQRLRATSETLMTYINRNLP